MQEDEYKVQYDKITAHKCAFEKALSNQRVNCTHAKHFYLAQREGYHCSCSSASRQCEQLLTLLTKKARFALKQNQNEGQVTHNAALKLQFGGLFAISQLIKKLAPAEIITDINDLLNQAIIQYQQLEKLPFTHIVRSIAQYRVTTRKQTK